MSVGSESAEQMVHIGIQVTESAAKLAAVGAKNLAAMLLALSRETKKTKGKTNLSAMLAEGRPLKVVRLKLDDLSAFGGECRKYGALYTAIRDRKATDGLCDVLVRADDAAKINRIMERMGYAVPQLPERKNGDSREASGKSVRLPEDSLAAPAPKISEPDTPAQNRLAGLRMAAQTMRGMPEAKQR